MIEFTDVEGKPFTQIASEVTALADKKEQRVVVKFPNGKTVSVWPFDPFSSVLHELTRSPY